ncbi:MAG TPA: DUF3833 family protein [Rhodanobacter sp.]|jgi:hypothetical protein|nr:DUF3833 family protein [Rhodanobacter sp.]
MKKAALVFAMTLLLGAVSARAGDQASMTFTPRTGFSGASKGHGTLTLFFEKPRPYHVDSDGRQLPDGTFRLDQTVSFQGKPARQRHWLLRTVRPADYAGTLSDAAGTVTGHTDGRRLVLRYRLKGPLVMHQTLEMMSDGTIDNVGRISVLGITVGHLRETIVRESSPAG